MDVEILGDRYELQEPIGRGGMATIYRANDLRMGRTVAIKILREVYSSDPKFVTRFQREARAASLLQHPNIVQVFDYGQSGESYYIVMEFIEGTDLRRYLKQRGRLNSERTASIAHDVALGLGAAHKRGIVHRDVKPQNIMLNDDDVVKLTDFGIASVYKDADAERLTTTGMTLGTVQYYAPEQAQGEVVTPAADIYAMGIVMYEMLTGRTPFEGDTPVAVAMKHIQDLPEPPSRYNPNVAPALENIIMRCLEKDPRDRYAHGDALAYALDNFSRRPGSRGAPVSAGRVGAPLSLPGDPRPVPGYGQAAYGGPSQRSGPNRGSMSPMGPASDPGNGRASNPRVYDAPGTPRPYGGMQGSMSRAPITGRPNGPSGIPMRPDEEGVGRRNGPIVAVVVGAVVLLLLASCGLAFALAGGPSGLAALFAQPTPTATIVMVRVPTFKGLRLPDAKTLATQTNIKLTVVYSTPSPTDTNPPAKDTVLDLSPEPGLTPGPLQAVTLTVASGPNQVTVPDVRGMYDTDACSKLQAKQLICQPAGSVQSNQPAGTVVKTDPIPGTPVDAHTIVLYYVSTGPPTPTTGPTATATCPTVGPGTPTPTPGGVC